MDSAKANDFKFTDDAYSGEFKKILAGITKCYRMLLDSKTPIPKNNENEIRNILVKDYLKNIPIREKINLDNYLFEREAPEDTSEGKVDIKISTPNTFGDSKAYYIIECKRLDNQNTSGISGLNGRYIKNGIMRFITGHYSTYGSINGMIGFVVKKMDIANNIQNINKLLQTEFSDAKTTRELTFIKIIDDFKYSYHSTHKGNKQKPITLYHLMFDFS